MEKTAHLKRAKSLGKHSEFEALVQVKQTVHHSETTARSKFPPPKKGKSVVDPSGGGETAGILVFVQTANWIPVLTKFLKAIH